MAVVRTEGAPRGKPGRRDHQVIYALDKVAWLFKTLRLDHLTGNLRIIDTFHSEVHEGEAFSAYTHTEDGADLTDDGETNLVFTVPAGRQIHLTGAGYCGGDAEVWFGGAGDITGGTPFTPVALNGVIVNVPTTTVLADATIGSFTSQFRGWIIGGTRQQATGGDIRADAERILGPGIHAIRLTNRAGSSKPADLRVIWYEEPIR